MSTRVNFYISRLNLFFFLVELNIVRTQYSQDEFVNIYSLRGLICSYPGNKVREKKHKTKAKTKGIVFLCLSLTQSRSLSIGRQKAAKPEGERRISKIETKINQTSFCFLFVSSALPKSHVFVIPPPLSLFRTYCYQQILRG